MLKMLGHVGGLGNETLAQRVKKKMTGVEGGKANSVVKGLDRKERKIRTDGNEVVHGSSYQRERSAPLEVHIGRNEFIKREREENHGVCSSKGTPHQCLVTI